MLFRDGTENGRRRRFELFIANLLSIRRTYLRFVTQNKWYHLHCSSMGKESAIVCFCPAKNALHDCVHTRFLKEFGEEQFEHYNPNTDDGSKYLPLRWKDTK